MLIITVTKTMRIMTHPATSIAPCGSITGCLVDVKSAKSANN